MKWIFIVGCPRTGSTLLLNILSTIPHSIAFYEPNSLSDKHILDDIRKESIENNKSVIIEKTPENIFYLDKLQVESNYNDEVFYIHLYRNPFETISSIVKASKQLPNDWDGEWNLDRCIERYSQCMAISYNYYLQDLHNHLFIDYFDLTNDTNKVLDYISSTIGEFIFIKDRINHKLKEYNKPYHNNLYKKIYSMYSVNHTMSVTEREYIKNPLGIPLVKDYYSLFYYKIKLDKLQYGCLFSIVIPLYNSEKTIYSTLYSLYKQDYENIEIIVVNDGSIDSSVEVVNKFINDTNYKKIKLYHNEFNKGLSYTRNKGIDYSIGEVIGFCDADDCWGMSKVRKSIEEFVKHPNIDVVLTDVVHIKDKKFTHLQNNLKNGYVLDQALEYNIGLCGSNIVAKRNCFNHFKFHNDYPGCEDWELIIKLARVYLFNKISTCDDVLVYYRDVDNSMSKNIDKMFSSSLNLINKYIDNPVKRKIIFTKTILHYYKKDFKLFIYLIKYLTKINVKYLYITIINKIKYIIKLCIKKYLQND